MSSSTTPAPGLVAARTARSTMRSTGGVFIAHHLANAPPDQRAHRSAHHSPWPCEVTNPHPRHTRPPHDGLNRADPQRQGPDLSVHSFWESVAPLALRGNPTRRLLVWRRCDPPRVTVDDGCTL